MVKLSDGCTYRKVGGGHVGGGSCAKSSPRRVKNGNSEVNMKG